MKSHFQKIINDYLISKNENFATHPIANFLRHDIPHSISKVVDDKERYLFQGSAGNGRWVACPWVAILDPLVTVTTQKGYYPVFLFAEDMSGLYLSFNQGVTSVKSQFGKGYKDTLKIRAENFRAKIGQIPSNFKEININLRQNKNTKTSLPGDYEAGNIIAKYYPADNIPNDVTLIKDIEEILKIYKLIVDDYNLGYSTVDKEEKEIIDIQKSNRTETQKKQLINARIGQGDFRKEVVKKETQCRLTGVSDLSFLIASHIRPWRDSNDAQKLDGDNGLLLSPHVDRLFDKGWITFTNEGEVLIYGEAAQILKTWNISIKNVGKFNAKQQVYLKYHRENIFKDKEFITTA